MREFFIYFYVSLYSSVESMHKNKYLFSSFSWACTEWVWSLDKNYHHRIITLELHSEKMAKAFNYSLLLLYPLLIFCWHKFSLILHLRNRLAKFWKTCLYALVLHFNCTYNRQSYLKENSTTSEVILYPSNKFDSDWLKFFPLSWLFNMVKTGGEASCWPVIFF